MSGIAAPVVGVIVAVFVLVFLVLRTRVHPVVAMLASACIAGLAGGMSVAETTDAITRGFGSTLGSIGLVIGLGVMMGRVLEVSGASEQIAQSFVRLLGRGREHWALALTGYFVSIPIFVDSAFVILFPIARALAATSSRSVISLGIALAGGLVVTHTIIPPTPGPLAVGGLFGVDIGAMMLSGMVLAIPCVAGIVAYALFLEKKFKQAFILPNVAGPANASFVTERSTPLPSPLFSWLPIAVPIGLILVKAVLGFIPAGQVSSQSWINWTADVFLFLGTPVVALSVSTVLAVYTLLPGRDKKESNALLEEGLMSAGIILLVTGAGGAIGAVIRESGAGTTIAGQIRHLPFSPVMIPFFVASGVRLIQGSGTVACITAASITAPVLQQLPEVNMLLAAQSAVMGALCFSYFNDSLFWVVNRMMGVADLRSQLMVWSLPTTIAWGIGGTLVALINLVAGNDGSLLDPLIPASAVSGILWLGLRKARSASRPA